MSFGINSEYGKNPKIGQGFGIGNINQTQKTEAAQVVDNKAIGEYGDKLLNQVQPQFVTAAKLPEADAVQLQEMFKMAGVSARYMPTQVVYDRVGKNTTAIAQQIDDVGTRGNAEAFLSSDTFKALDDIFNLS